MTDRLTASDRSHLRFLEILHYVQAGLWVVMVLWSAVSLLFFQSFFDQMFENALMGPQRGRQVVEVQQVDAEPDEGTPAGPTTRPPMPPGMQEFEAMFDGLFTVIIAVQIGWGLLAGVATLAAGLCLRRRRGRAVIYVASVLNILNIPLGTALGVFTFIVIGRPTVSAAFDESP